MQFALSTDSLTQYASKLPGVERTTTGHPVRRCAFHIASRGLPVAFQTGPDRALRLHIQRMFRNMGRR
jgi:hypothetical protein